MKKFSVQGWRISALQMFDKKPLQIDFCKGKAVAFYLDIPEENKAKTPMIF